MYITRTFHLYYIEISRNFRRVARSNLGRDRQNTFRVSSLEEGKIRFCLLRSMHSRSASVNIAVSWSLVSNGQVQRIDSFHSCFLKLLLQTLNDDVFFSQTLFEFSHQDFAVAFVLHDCAEFSIFQRKQSHFVLQKFELRHEAGEPASQLVSWGLGGVPAASEFVHTDYQFVN